MIFSFVVTQAFCLLGIVYGRLEATVGRYAGTDVVRSRAPQSSVNAGTDYCSAGGVIDQHAATDVVHSAARSPSSMRDSRDLYCKAGVVVGRFAAQLRSEL